MRSIRQKVAFFMGISSLLALLLGVLLTIIHYEGKVRHQSSTELSSISRATPTMIETKGAELTSLGRALTISTDMIVPIVEKDHKALFAYLAKFVSVNHLEYAEYTDSEGTIVLHLTDSLSVGKRSQNPLVRVALSGSPYGHGILRQNDQLYVIATLPIVYQNALLGTITIGEDFNPELMQRMSAIPGVELAVWEFPDRQAIIPPGKTPLPPITRILTEDELNRIGDGEVIVKNLDVRGENFQSAFFVLNELGGNKANYCANYRSMKFLKEAGLLTAIHISALLLLVILLMIQYTWWISKRVTNPLERLIEFTRKLTHMDFSEQVPVTGNDEISELAVSFNNLSSALQENISQKDKYAGELADLNTKLESLVIKRTEELENINFRLKREIEDKDAFLRTVSHDLGAPLRNIAGLAQMVEKKFAEHLGTEGKDRLRRIRKNVANELEMIEQLLELSRIKTRRRSKVRVDIMDLLTQIRQSLSYSIEEKGIHMVVLDILPTIMAEKDRIKQVFQNLLDNAIKYIGDQKEPEIQIGWSENPDHHLFWVQDNGIGIPEDQKDKVFGIFHRVKSKEISSIQGKGVGLASVKAIVEMYGGEIWVESQPGRGSTFYFTLNRRQVDPNMLQEQEEETEAERELMAKYEADTDY